MIFVESKYGSRWKGVVLKEYSIYCHYPKKYKGVGYIVLVIKDRNGNIPNKRIIHSRNKDWFKVIEPFDISNINTDWFKNYKNSIR